MKKLKNILKEIGFRDRMDKEVDDESKAEFQDFGEYVGQLYQSFQDKDLKSKPEVAQKIRDLVSVEDESVLIQKVKDLEFLINQLPDKPESTEKMGFRQRNEQEMEYTRDNTFTYNENFLKDKLGNPVKDVYEFNNDNGHMTIYPDLGNSKYKDRSSQFIRFELKDGEVHFVSAFGYKRGYDMLKSVLPELPPMGDSSYAGRMNVNTDGGTIPVGIDTANKMIDALNSGLDAEAGAQSDFYGKRGSTSGTVDEVESEDDTEFTVSLKHLLKKHVTKGGKMDEEVNPSYQLAYLLFKEYAKQNEDKLINRIKNVGSFDVVLGKIFNEVVSIWIEWAAKTSPSYMDIDKTETQGFGKKIAFALGKDNIVFTFEGNKLTLKGEEVNEMTNDEFEKAKEADRLEKHPEKDKIMKIRQLINKELKELTNG